MSRGSKVIVLRGVDGVETVCEQTSTQLPCPPKTHCDNRFQVDVPQRRRLQCGTS